MECKPLVSDSGARTLCNMINLLVAKDRLFFIFCLFAISWATSAAHGDSQARGRIRAIAATLRRSHSNAGSEPSLQPTPQLKARLDH